MQDLVVEDAIENFKSHTSKAATTLVQLLNADNPALQRNVANDILQHVLQFKELQEIETRLEALEKNANSKFS